jgi:hypothetical protein
MDVPFAGDTEGLVIGSRFWVLRDLRKPRAKRPAIEKVAWEVTGILEHGISAKPVAGVTDEVLPEYQRHELRAAPTKLRRLAPKP